MNEAHRPTSGATAGELAAQLCATRSHTRRLTEDLSGDQLMGPMLPIVNPVLWEIGHVGWFHEFWTLRHAHGDAPLLARADRLWNSSTVAHATRWDLDLPDRDGVFRYMADVLARQTERLSGGIDGLYKGLGAVDRLGDGHGEEVLRLHHGAELAADRLAAIEQTYGIAPVELDGRRI